MCHPRRAEISGNLSTASFSSKLPRLINKEDKMLRMTPGIIAGRALRSEAWEPRWRRERFFRVRAVVHEDLRFAFRHEQEGVRSW